ncbi:MAG TPA: YeiH family protein [Gammaproteobacteria bacterium]|nr:YeiH family protein [Gammaproteobacteria bacterium]
MVFSKQDRANTLSGLLFVALFALSSLYLAEISFIANAGISSLVLAIVLGIIYSNTLRHRLPDEWVPGVHFSAKQLLRLAIILYGFRVSFQQIASIGIEGIVIDIFVVVSTLLLGYVVGVKLFKLDRHLALLISAGSAICGAAAVLAVEDVLKSDAYKAAVAVGTVVLFGTTAMFVYPLLQHAGWLNFTPIQYGIFAGASVHEVAQALVAGTNVSIESGNVAVVVKMCRVLLLVPVLLFLSFNENRINAGTSQKSTKLTIPWFAILFIVMIGFNSLQLLPAHMVTLINQFDVFLLTMAMAAIGMETNLNKIKKVGLKPLYLAVLLFAWLTLTVYLAVRFF